MLKIMIKNYKCFLLIIMIIMAASCKDGEDAYDTSDCEYYLNIQSEVDLNLREADEGPGTQSTKTDSEYDRISNTLKAMLQVIEKNKSLRGDNRARQVALLSVCDSLYRNYADVNPANKGHLVCFVKLIRIRRSSNGAIKDAVALKNYQFWYDKPDDNGGENGGGDVKDYLGKPDSLEAVDLGLSVLWANCNIGSKQPRNYGAHLAWADSTGALWSGQGIGWNDNGYTWYTDNYGGITPPADITGKALDIVTKYWGDGWRIPTYSEAKELCEQCQWKLRTYGDIKWYEVIGPSGNSIIMPLAGMYGDVPKSSNRFQEGPYHVGERGYYWTSTSCTTPATAEHRGYGVNDGVVTAWCFGFNSSDGTDLTPVLIDHLRAMHMSIRPCKYRTYGPAAAGN